MSAHYEQLIGDLYNYDYFLQDDVCRLCWRRDAEREILPKTSQKLAIMKNELMEQLRNCLDLDFTDDTYPNKVCNECYNKVQEFNAFKCFCQETDRKLCEIFRKQREKVTKDGYFELKIEPGYFDTVDSFYESTNTSDHEPADIIDTKAPVKKEIKKDKIKRGTKFQNYCYNCKIDCKTKELYLSHKSQLHGIEENGTKFKCFGCEKRFRSAKRRGAHEREFCRGLKDGYKCLKCDRYLPSRKAHELHMIAHRKNKVVDLPELSFECKSCCSKFKTVQRFRDHLNNDHPETRKKYVCEMCGRVFSRADYLYKHKKTHSGSKPHGCAHCAFRTSQRTTLIMHMRRHTGERPYLCDVCPQRCVSSSNLRAHRRTHLGQDKQHECNICSKKFSYKLSLEEHISSCHDRSQSFICDHCGATYNRQRGLRRHLAAKHGQLTETKDGSESTVLDESVCE